MADLASVKLFQGLPAKELKAVASSGKEMSIPAGKDIMTSGHHGVGFMVILEGEAEVHLADGSTRKLGPGDHFGEMALLDEKGRSATVKALTEMKVLTIPEWEFKPFLADHPEVSWRLLQALSRRVREK